MMQEEVNYKFVSDYWTILPECFIDLFGTLDKRDDGLWIPEARLQAEEGW